jgi:hypothetical protein
VDFGDPEVLGAFAAIAQLGDAATYHPPIGERLAALRRLGATTEAASLVPPPRRRSRVLAVLSAPFRLLALLFQLAVPIFALAVALFLGVIYVVPVVALLHHLLR